MKKPSPLFTSPFVRHNWASAAARTSLQLCFVLLLLPPPVTIFLSAFAKARKLLLLPPPGDFFDLDPRPINRGGRGKQKQPRKRIEGRRQQSFIASP